MEIRSFTVTFLVANEIARVKDASIADLMEPLVVPCNGMLVPSVLLKNDNGRYIHDPLASHEKREVHCFIILSVPHHP